jgi:hypothetical protein
MSEAEKVTDHEQIRRWAQERGARPAAVAETESDGDAGILRFDFNEPDEGLDEISWDEFFAKFEEKNLALLLQDETKDGSESRFFKFVER